MRESFQKYPGGSDRQGASKKGKRKRDSEIDRVSAQTHNLISFLGCQGITGELTELRV